MVVLAAFLVVFTPIAHAVLGESDGALEAEGVKARASVAKTQFSSYSLHEQAIDKITVRQFSDTSSKVFAVTWRGKTHPDFATLLGTHFAEYQAALSEAKLTHHGHGPLQIDFGNMHLEMGGQPRSVYGRIWLKDQLPKDINTNDLQ